MTDVNDYFKLVKMAHEDRDFANRAVLMNQAKELLEELLKGDRGFLDDIAQRLVEKKSLKGDPLRALESFLEKNLERLDSIIDDSEPEEGTHEPLDRVFLKAARAHDIVLLCAVSDYMAQKRSDSGDFLDDGSRDDFSEDS